MAKPRSEFLNRIGIHTARVACILLSPLSIRALRRIGAGVGGLACHLNGRAVRTTRTNIDLVYGQQARAWRQRLVRDSIRQTTMTVLEAAALWTWPLSRLAALVCSVEGEHLLRHRAEGRGALILAPHFGNWEFLGYYLNTIEPLAPLYQRPASPVIDATLSAARMRLGHRRAPDTVAGLRLLIQVLRHGGMVAVLPDQVPTAGAGVIAPFFGHDAFTMSLVPKLLTRVDADVLIAAAARVPDGFSIRIESVGEAIRDSDPAASAQAMNAAIEAVVARDPAQYQWEYKRYRFPHQPNIYR